MRIRWAGVDCNARKDPVTRRYGLQCRGSRWLRPGTCCCGATCRQGTASESGPMTATGRRRGGNSQGRVRIALASSRLCGRLTRPALQARLRRAAHKVAHASHGEKPHSNWPIFAVLRPSPALLGGRLFVRMRTPLALVASGQSGQLKSFVAHELLHAGLGLVVDGQFGFVVGVRCGHGRNATVSDGDQDCE